MSKLTVMIGDSEGLLIEFLTDVINEVISDNYKLEVLATSKTDELLLLAGENDVDLFIPVLNNLIFTSNLIPGETRVGQGIQFVSYLKDTFQKPIIALAGWPNDPDFPDKVISAGADRFFKLPFKMKELQGAVRDCLAGVFDPH